MHIRNAELELTPRAKQGAEASEPTAERARAWMESEGCVILSGPFRAARGGSVWWAPGVVHVEFSKKTATGQALHPNSNLYLEVQLLKKKKKSQMPDTDQKDEESIEESWQESLKPVKSMPTAFPPAFFS